MKNQQQVFVNCPECKITKYCSQACVQQHHIAHVPFCHAIQANVGSENKRYHIERTRRDIAHVMHRFAVSLSILGALAYAIGGRGALCINYDEFLKTKELNPTYITKHVNDDVRQAFATYDPSMRVMILWTYDNEYDICFIAVAQRNNMVCAQ
jgi:hypothetical protein